jgi:hypothetical protein
VPNPILPDIVEEAARVLDEARARDVLVRALGGVAVQLHATNAVHPAFRRPCGDIDLVTTGKAGRRVAGFIVEMGYTPNDRFNAMNGQSRLVFYDDEYGRQLDVFVGDFTMCHRLPLAARLDLEERTVPLAELLLTKLQVVRLNEKDLKDLWAIVDDHEVGENDEETVNAAYIARLLAADWGLWRTTKETTATARQRLLDFPVDEERRARIVGQLGRLWERIEAEPKSLRWRARARIGDRTRWYQEPEEVEHAERQARAAAEETGSGS